MYWILKMTRKGILEIKTTRSSMDVEKADSRQTAALFFDEGVAVFRRERE